MNKTANPSPAGVVPSEVWKAHAYPLQQVTILLQGTRHVTREALASQLETVIARLKAGETDGHEHDDDFGYAFEVLPASSGPSFFPGPSGSDH